MKHKIIMSSVNHLRSFFTSKHIINIELLLVISDLGNDPFYLVVMFSIQNSYNFFGIATSCIPTSCYRTCYPAKYMKYLFNVFIRTEQFLSDSHSTPYLHININYGRVKMGYPLLVNTFPI